VDEDLVALLSDASADEDDEDDIALSIALEVCSLHGICLACAQPDGTGVIGVDGSLENSQGGSVYVRFRTCRKIVLTFPLISTARERQHKRSG
jgi:hypothetical protein